MQGYDLQQLVGMLVPKMRSLTFRVLGARNPQRVRDDLTEEEIRRLFDMINNVRDAVGYYRGLRASERNMIDVNNYAATLGRLTIRSAKASCGKECYVTQAARCALTDWLRKRGTAPAPLFISRNQRGISRFSLHSLNG